MWQKVTNDKHAHYKDFCNGVKVSDRPEVIYRNLQSGGLMTPKPKSDYGSEMCRKVGNNLFEENKWSKAMEMYNRSICAAETMPSRTISLAYANRSACFFGMKNYDKCLIDIDLAKKANYPLNLMPKLDQRKEDCLQFIASGDQVVPFVPKLSFESHEKFPCMANILEIKRNDEFGRHITSKCDIAVGQTVLIEEAYMTAHRYEKFRRCDSCMKKDVNLIPCNKCSQAMFCCIECQNSFFHQVECGMQPMPEEHCNDNQLHIIRSLLQAVQLFSTAEELQSFVEDALASDPLEIPESILDEKSRYRAFLKLWYEPNVFNRNTFNQQVYFVHQTLLQNEIIGPKFNSAKKKRFFMHLIAQHFCIINYSGNITFDNSDDMVGWESNEFRSVITLYVNHSCAPNVTLVLYDGYNVLITIRPIKKGEQLFLTYFRNDKINHSTNDRRKYLLARGRFHCKCPRCENISPSAAERVDMKKDECFTYITKNKRNVNFGLDGAMETETAKMLEKNCVEFLNKHGEKVWCEEVEMVTDCYKRFLAATFNNEIRF